MYLTVKNKDSSLLGDVKQILQAVKTIFCPIPTFIFLLVCDQNDSAFT